MRKIVFLDRDGVINQYPGDTKYVTNWRQFRFLPGAKDALKQLNQAGYSIYVISNQAGVSKGIYTQESLDEITENMLRELNEAGVKIEEVTYCTHLTKDNCSCRKPKTGSIEKVLKALDIKDTSGIFFVGDATTDVETGKSAGLKTILVFSGREKPQNRTSWQVLPDYTAQDLPSAVHIILNSN